MLLDTTYISTQGPILFGLYGLWSSFITSEYIMLLVSYALEFNVKIIYYKNLYRPL